MLTLKARLCSVSRDVCHVCNIRAGQKRGVGGWGGGVTRTVMVSMKRHSEMCLICRFGKHFNVVSVEFGELKRY